MLDVLCDEEGSSLVGDEVAILSVISHGAIDSQAMLYLDQMLP